MNHSAAQPLPPLRAARGAVAPWAIVACGGSAFRSAPPRPIKAGFSLDSSTPLRKRPRAQQSSRLRAVPVGASFRFSRFSLDRSALRRKRRPGRVSLSAVSASGLPARQVAAFVSAIRMRSETSPGGSRGGSLLQSGVGPRRPNLFDRAVKKSVLKASNCVFPGFRYLHPALLLRAMK